MKIRFFLLGTEGYGSAPRLQAELKQLFSPCLTDDGDIQSFDNIRSATSDIARAVSDSHALIFIADTEQYATTKRMLSKAFGFGLSCDTQLLTGACETLGKDTGEEDGDFAVAHAFVPKNATTFVLEDSLYTGFSVANGNQTIILLPLCKARTTVLIANQVIPYINAAYHTSISTDALKEYNTEKLLEVLDEHNVSLAVAGTNTANFLKEYLALEEKEQSRVVISPLAEKRGNLQPVDYVVNLSITAAELMSCPYSVAISNAFYTGDSPESEKIVYIAVSNERETAVREIHSLPGEEISAFLSRCCGDLCVFVCDVISDDDAFKTDIKTRESAAVKRYKIAIAAASAVLAALIIFVAAYFTSHDYSLKAWYDNFMEWIFPAGNPLDDIFEKDASVTDATEGEASAEEKSSDEEASSASAAEQHPAETENTSDGETSGEGATAEALVVG